jgi:hypothetical protein
MFANGTLYNFRLMARKAHFSIIYPSSEQHDDLKAMKQYERCKHAILCYTAVKQEQRGNSSIMTELAIDLLLESRVYDKDAADKATLAELKRPHPVICIDIAKRLVLALGCSNLFDHAHPICKSNFETDAVAAVLKDAQSHNLQRSRSGAPTLSWINAVLQSTVCLCLERQINEKLWRLSVPRKTGYLLQGHTLLQHSWFEEKWGLKAPRLDQFKPCTTDTKAKLTAIRGVFKQSQDATSQAFVKHLDAMILGRGDEGGRAVRDFSFHHVQNLKPKFKIDAKTVAARAAACFACHESRKRKAEEEMQQVQEVMRAERNAAFAKRFKLTGHKNKAVKEAARHAIDAYWRQAPKLEVHVNDKVDTATRSLARAATSGKARN